MGAMADHLRTNPSILIVGAGPTGLTAAVQLVHHGIRPRVIDKKSGPTGLSKAAAVNARSLELLSPSGMSDRLIEAGLIVREGNLIYEGKRLAQLHFDNIPHKYNFLLAIPQSETERELIGWLQERGVEVEWQRELVGIENSETGVKAKLGAATGDDSKPAIEDETAEVEYLAATDGPHSTVRHALGLEFIGRPYTDDFSLADVTMDWPYPENEIELFMHEDGQILFVAPFGGKRYRLISNTGAVKDLLPPGCTINETLWESDFHVQLRQVPSYQQGRCYLAGDAAHVHSPAGGRGMNLGMEDATMLARKLAIDSPEARQQALATYSEERHPAGEAVLDQSDRIFKVASQKDWLKRTLRNLAMPVLLASDDVQAHFLREMAGLSGHTDEG